MKNKEEKYSKEFIKEVEETELDEFNQPDWWDENLDKNK